MIPNPSRWDRLIDALVSFDMSAAPVGLYAAEEFRMKSGPHPRMKVEWDQALSPALKELGCVCGRPETAAMRDGRFTFVSQDGMAGSLEVVPLSAIKVRRYGNGYRLDPHLDLSARWKKSEIAEKASLLSRRNWKGDSASEIRLLLLLGFASERLPFAARLREIQSKAEAAKKPLLYTDRIWADPHGRGFNIVAALWVFEPSANQ